MAFCPRCKIEQLGGSRCSRCGRALVEREFSPGGGEEAKADSWRSSAESAQSVPLPQHLQFLERESRYKVERKRPGILFYLGAFFARCVESVVFCTAFHFVLITIIFILKAITELTRTGGEIYESSWLEEVKQGIQLYEYFAFVLITLLTFKYRWPKR